MKIVTKKVKNLKVDINTVKEHPPEQIEKLKASITEFGFNKPLVIGSKNQVLAGAGVLQALIELDVKEVDCVDMSRLSKDKQKAFILADNKLSEYSAWDMKSVSDLIRELELNDYDLELTAFNTDDLRALDDQDLSWMGEHESTPDGLVTKPSKTDEGYSSIEFIIPVEAKGRIMEKVRETKTALGLNQDGEALIAIIESYGG